MHLHHLRGQINLEKNHCMNHLQSTSILCLLRASTSEFSCEAETDWEWHCWLTVPWTRSRGPLAPCGKACHSGNGWHCLCGRSSWSSRAHAPAEAHQRCLTLESPHRSADLETKCQGADRKTGLLAEEEEQEDIRRKHLESDWLWMSNSTLCSEVLRDPHNL